MRERPKFFGRLPQTTLVAPELRRWKPGQACVTVPLLGLIGGVRMLARGLAILCVSCLAAPAAAADPQAPTGKWVLNYEAAQCNAYRNYGTEKDPLYLAFKAPPVGDVVQLMVVQDGPRMSAEQRDINVRIGDRPPLKTNMLVYRQKAKFRTKLINLPRAEFEALRDAPSVEIKGEGQDYAFALSDTASLMKALDTCLADLRDHYNVSAPGVPIPRLQRGAVGNLTRLFSAQDYPGVAVTRRMEGTTGLELLIDENGSVADCSVTATSGYAIIDAQSCAVIMKRAKFAPAIDLQGKPTRSTYSQRISWVMKP